MKCSNDGKAGDQLRAMYIDTFLSDVFLWGKKYWKKVLWLWKLACVIYGCNVIKAWPSKRRKDEQLRDSTFTFCYSDKIDFLHFLLIMYSKLCKKNYRNYVSRICRCGLPFWKEVSCKIQRPGSWHKVPEWDYAIKWMWINLRGKLSIFIIPHTII